MQRSRAIPVVTLSLFRFRGLGTRLWVLGQMALAQGRLRREGQVQFARFCGSGTGHGFTPRPNWDVWGILAVWPDEATARRALADSAVLRGWFDRAQESWTLLMAPIAARGLWGGVNAFAPAPGDSPPPTARTEVAALTRATLRPRHAWRFWRQVPDIEARIGADPNVRFKIGLGEVPLLHQVTFSIWPDPATMAQFARADGPHARAIRAVRDGDWFAEELYARFRVLEALGSWGGGNPLAPPQPERTAA